MKCVTCDHVKIGKRSDQPPRIPVWEKVESIPQTINGYRILYAHPKKCVITPTTHVDFVDFYELREEERERNYLVKLIYEGHTEYYIFPKKVWRIIRDRYIEPMMHGEAPTDPGFLLYGAPGTGKTSMIEIIATSLGLHTITVSADEVLSKWVGEGEKNLARKMDEAEATEPSIMVIDDAEWLVRSRDLMHTDINNVSSLLSIILNRLQRWKRQKRRIIVAVATNVSPAKIDPALLRAGRLGRPIFIPLPDVEAIDILLEVYKVEEKLGSEKKEELKRKILSYGANMADAVQAINDLLEGREPQIEQFVGRGYVRPYNPHTFNRAPFTISSATLSNENTRLYFPASDVLGVPILVSYLNRQGHTSILVKDFRYIDEVMATAEASRSVLIVPTSIAESSGRDIYSLIHYNSKTGVIWVGEDPPKTPYFELSSLTAIISTLDMRKEVIESIFSYYNIKTEERVINKLLSLSEKKFVDTIKKIVLLKSGGIVQEEDVAWL